MGVPDADLTRGAWKRTPRWVFWRPMYRRPVYAFFGPRLRWEYSDITDAPELLEVVKAFVAQEVDYMKINNLGDPEKQHNVKWARAVIARAEGRLPSPQR